MNADWELPRDYGIDAVDLEKHLEELLRQQEDRGFRFLHRRSKTAPGTQRHAVAFGIKAGYWPCHKGPFITIEFATHRIDMWYGTPSFEA